jgi:hypothetical protein
MPMLLAEKRDAGLSISHVELPEHSTVPPQYPHSCCIAFVTKAEPVVASVCDTLRVRKSSELIKAIYSS